VFCRRWLGSVLFLVLGPVGLNLVMLCLLGLSYVMLSLVVFALGLLRLMVFALSLLRLMVFTLSLLRLMVFTLSLMMFSLGLLRLVVFTVELLTLVVFALDLLSLVVFPLVLFAFLVFTGLDLSRTVRVPMIDRVALALLMTSRFLMGALGICRLDMLTVCRRFLLSGRSGVDPSRAIEADVIIDGRMVDHRTVHISIVDG
jgi:hypothetical protein